MGVRRNDQTVLECRNPLSQRNVRAVGGAFYEDYRIFVPGVE